MRYGAWVVIAGVALTACSSSGGDRDSEPAPCIDDDALCGTQCSNSEPCAGGLYCTESGQCAKECLAAATHGDKAACSGDATCSVNGQCQDSDAKPSSSKGPEIAGGRLPSGSGGGPSTGLRDGGPSTVDEPECAETTVRATRVIPTVILIVDQSGSMTDDFGGGGSRWNVLRDFLLEEPTGLIADLQKQVNFGFAMYSAMSMPDGPLPVGECPLVVTVPPALDNFQAIADVYRANEPLDDTPTGDSIDKIVADLDLANDPDTKTNPTVFVLATDGEPDRCEELDPQTDTAKQEAVDAVTRAFALGIRTFVISVGNEIGADHQQAIANAGLGKMPGEPDAEYWVTGDDASLRTALMSIVGSQLGCDIALKGKVESDNECLGRVTLNGAELECNGADGWKLTDPEHIQLLGTACEELKAGDDVVLDVSFPCDVEVLI
jgi:hypothetical protein